MRKLAATALTALTLSLMGSVAALADHDVPNQGPRNPQYQAPVNPGPGPNSQLNQNPRGPRGGQFDEHFDDDDFDGGRGFNDHRFDNDSRFNLRFDFGRHNGSFDRWERGWGFGNWNNQHRFHQPLNYWRLTRILERQGFYGVRGLQKARFGFGYRAFAFTGRGRPVMLRLNPYTGRVMDVRYI
jgi:hypothetical protein